MALNRSARLMPGLTGIIARIEKLGEPGQPRQYWDGAGKAWSPAPASHIPVIPDPDLSGVYLTLLSTAEMASWPDGIYRETLLNPEITTGDQVAREPADFYVIAGDDGSVVAYPSVTLPILGGTITIWGARLNTPRGPAVTLAQ